MPGLKSVKQHSVESAAVELILRSTSQRPERALRSICAADLAVRGFRVIYGFVGYVVENRLVIEIHCV